MTPSPLFVDGSTPISQCRALLDDGRIRHLPVVEDGWLVGVLHALDVLAADPNATAAELTPQPVPSVAANVQLDDALAVLGSTATDVVVATEEGAPVGLFSEHDVVVYGAEVLPSSFTVAAYMTQPLSSIDASAPCSAARDRFGEELQRHLVVRFEGTLFGMLSWRDVQHREDAIQVAECVQPVQFRVSEDATLADAAALMARHHVGALPVMNATEVVGVVSRTDVLAALRCHVRS
jgi:CBS domain-containing protein